ncbi:MAG: hypothetical protein NTZ80_03230 [Patescibacteria group bacterium]|nr:hypothetical protein [Patescibacteria group bacterium]
MINFATLLTWTYWFANPTMSSTTISNALLIIFGALIVIGLLLKVYFRYGSFHPVMRKFIKPIPGNIMRWGITGMLLAFFRLENVHYLSWRFLWVIFAIWAIYMIVKKILFFHKEYPRRMELYKNRNHGKEWQVGKNKSKKK